MSLIQRAALKPILWSNMTDSLRQAFLATDAALNRTAEVTDGLAYLGLNHRLPAPLFPHRGIHHPLTAKFPPVLEPLDLRCSREEMAILSKSNWVARDLPKNGMASTLLEISRRIGEHGNFRTSGVATSSDPAGRRVVFPNAEEIEGQLELFDHLRKTEGSAPKFYFALLALMLITNCHPFIDGNGRSARILFNALLSQNCEHVRVYIPVREFAEFSRGGYLIRMRQAEIRGDIEAILDFFASIVHYWLNLLTFNANFIQDMFAQNESA